MSTDEIPYSPESDETDESDESDESDYEAKPQRSHTSFERLDLLLPTIRAGLIAGDSQNPGLERAIAEVITICTPSLSNAAYGKLLACRYLRDELPRLAEIIATQQINKFLVEQLRAEDFKYLGWRQAISYLCQGAKWEAKRQLKTMCGSHLVRIDDVVEYGDELGEEDKNLLKLEAEAERRELIKAMDKAHLTPREVEVVYDTYFADLGGEAIAKRIKATPRQVIRIRSRAIGKLRRYFGEGGQDRWQISC